MSRQLLGLVFLTTGMLCPCGVTARAQMPPLETPRKATPTGVPDSPPPEGTVCVRHEGMVITAVFSPDGKTLASSGWDNLVRLWDPATGKELRQCKGHEGAVYNVVFSADGKLLASSSADRSIRLWDAATGKEVGQLQGHTNGVTKVAFTPDGKSLVSGGYDHTVRVWDLASRKEIRQLGTHAATVYGVAVSPDGRLAASGGGGSAIFVHELATGNEVRRIGQGSIAALTFSPDGRTLASANTGDNTVSLWEVATGLCHRQMHGHQSAVWAVAFSADGRTVASASQDKTARLWETATGMVRRQLTGHGDGISSVVFAPDGRTLATASHDKSALIWNVPGTGSQSRPAPLSRKGVEDLWISLAGPDPDAAYSSLWTLAGVPEQIVPLLRERLRPVAPIDADQVNRLIVALDDDEFAVREKAMNELEALGEPVKGALDQALKGDVSLEVRRRLDQLLAGLTISPHDVRTLRALEILEMIGTPEAREVVERLARGAPQTVLTDEAKATLERLKQRSSAEP